VPLPNGGTRRSMLPLHHRVLLADDDLEVRRGVEDLLLPLGLEIVHAESGLEALAIATLRDPRLDLMVLDMHMPGCTGLEVLSRLRQAPSFRVPCIFYSGEATLEVERRALEAGAWAFLRKPVQPDQLRGEVLRALRNDFPSDASPADALGPSGPIGPGGPRRG